MVDARPLDQGSPKTKPRSCGIQPEYESLLNRRLSSVSCPAHLHPSDRLGPTASLFDPLSMFQRKGVALVAGGAAVDGGMAGLLRNMRGDTGPAQILDEFGRVIALVRPQRQPSGRAGGMSVDHVEHGLPFGMAISPGQLALHDQAVAVLHQRMADEAQHGTGAEGFLVKPRVGIGHRNMRRIRAFLASK